MLKGLFSIIAGDMSTLSSRISESVNAAKERGYSIADIAQECGISVQSVYHWLSGETQDLKSNSLLGLAKVSGFSPWYIYEGVGEKVLYIAKNEPQKIVLKVMENLDDDKQYIGARLIDTLVEHKEKNNGTQ